MNSRSKQQQSSLPTETEFPPFQDELELHQTPEKQKHSNLFFLRASFSQGLQPP